MVAGATGYIGRAVVTELRRRQYPVVATVRSRIDSQRPDFDVAQAVLADIDTLEIELTDSSQTVERLGQLDFDAVVSCLASRTGTHEDAWAVDYEANMNLLQAAQRAGVNHFVLLSAICVQRPRLAFQRAKLAFEKKLSESGMSFSIVRPTAYFKSLAGQVERVMSNKPFLVFGDGALTSCKPIGEQDLAGFIVNCLEDPSAHSGVLPIGGPGEPITPRAQGELLFELTERTPRFRSVPVGVFDIALGLLSPLARVSRRLEEKAELARIGRYYATESMLVWDPEANAYDAKATPSWGQETLRDYYTRILSEGLSGQSLRGQRIF